MEVSLRCGDPALAVWHGMQVLQEMKANGKLKVKIMKNNN